MDNIDKYFFINSINKLKEKILEYYDYKDNILKLPKNAQSNYDIIYTELKDKKIYDNYLNNDGNILSTLKRTLEIKQELNISKERCLLNIEKTLENNLINIDREIQSKIQKTNFKNIYNTKINWKKNFKKILNDYQCTYLSNLKNLKNNNLPSSLFKYKNINANSIAGLINDEIWLSNPSDFNDPYDCAFTINLDINGDKLIKDNINHYPEDLKKEMLKMIKLTERHYENKISEEHNIKYKDSIKVFSFSENKYVITMWSHYADNHKGFCIEYETKKIGYQNINFLYPVVYVNKLLDINKFKFNFDSSIYFALRKFSEWKDEQEWRLVFPYYLNTKNSYKFSKPKAVYMGTKTTLSNLKMLINICKQKNIPLYKMEMESKKYKLNCELLDDGTKKDYSKPRNYIAKKEAT